MRTARTSWKTYALGAAAVAALLSSTACDSGGTDGGKNPGVSGAPRTTGAPSASATPSPAGTTAPGGRGSTGPSQSAGGGSAKPGGGDTTLAACNDNDLSIVTSGWRQDSGQRLLITATNFTDKACILYHYPYVRFGTDIGAPVSPMESKPRAVATIGPKEKAYAGVFVFRAGQQTRTVTSFSLGYQDRAPDSNRDVAPLDIRLSDEVGSLTVGPDPRVTYWNTDLRAVEDFLFRSGNRQADR
ncbi:DUF4232 domain-containing protein [Streptomyces sp. MB09-01]|uniref:DUF4232 domain-containing protein n=1 Tax=Streptomyces sp. MB09-01 TaxID=3028666 RepID=UPI0029A9980E|nr:DUF4232 domain-containing protein [Streptomyces sp. MB09-01]MDX3537938.1 DUF4232 domain-containing protein [Streptomyces sp. MB09-01]